MSFSILRCSSVEVFKGQDVVEASDEKEEAAGDTINRSFVLMNRNMCMCACVAVRMYVLLFRACCMFASIASACGREERQAQASNIWGRLILIYAWGRLLSETLYKHMYAWELDRPRRVVFGALPERASCRWPRVGA